MNWTKFFWRSRVGSWNFASDSCCTVLLNLRSLTLACLNCHYYCIQLYIPLLFLHRINCLFAGSGAPVPLLSRPDRNRHVPAEQQFTLPQLPTQPSRRLPRQRSSRLSLNWRPAAVPFHKGKERHRIKTISIDNVPKSSIYGDYHD